MTTTIAPLLPEHWEQVRDIYAEGIATGHATFEAEPPSWQEFDSGKLAEHRFVALAAQAGESGAPIAEPTDGSNSTPVAGAQVLGWAAVSPVSGRCVYAGVVEVAVYVAERARGRGAGRALLDAVLRSTADVGIWTVQSGTFPENTASLALQKSAGFRVVGVRERIARMSFGPLAGQWRDVVLSERRLP